MQMGSEQETYANSRRGFLRGLATLPLIGGSVTLIGSPSASAVPVTKALVDSYDAWLEYERRLLQWELCGNRRRWIACRFPTAPG